MTDKAGAVAWPGEARPADDGDGYIAVSFYVEHRMTPLQARLWNSCRAACIAAHERSTPPAAVSVEALEGLAAEWEAEAAALLGKSKRAANHVAAGGLNTRAAQLRKLIKERSNG